MEIIIIFLGLIILNYIIGKVIGNLDVWEVQMLEEIESECNEDKT